MVASLVSLKIILAIIAILDLECRQFDIGTAFLNAKIEGDLVYVCQPPGFKKEKGKVYLLFRVVYRLRNSPLL